jgi:hypothetical protein
MPYLIEIDFAECPGDETIVHRVRNFGEDLWQKFHTGDQAKIDLNAVDAASTRADTCGSTAPRSRDTDHQHDLGRALPCTLGSHIRENS